MTPEEASKKYNWIKINENGEVEMFCDHHMLQSVRLCEAYFIESILNNVQQTGKAWALDFGTWFHTCMEYFDEYEASGRRDYTSEFISKAMSLWKDMALDSHNDKKQYQALKGKEGALLLLAQYWNTYGNGKERLRTVGTELPFGKNKEVFLGDLFEAICTDEFPDVTIKCYYTGRLDRIVDDGKVISPMDRKTTSYFDGNESGKFSPHDGMQGYVYATQKLVNTITNGEAARQGRLCNSIIIDHVSVRSTNIEHERFKRSFKTYTPMQMEEWRLRQLASFRKIWELLIEERAAIWNTYVCNSYYYHGCPYKTLHENDPMVRESLVKSFYTIGKAWSPYPEEEKKGVIA